MAPDVNYEPVLADSCCKALEAFQGELGLGKEEGCDYDLFN